MAWRPRVRHSLKMNHGPTAFENAVSVFQNVPTSHPTSVTAVWKAACTDLPLQFCCWCMLKRFQGQIHRNTVCVCVLHQQVRREITHRFPWLCLCWSFTRWAFNDGFVMKLYFKFLKSIVLHTVWRSWSCKRRLPQHLSSGLWQHLHLHQIHTYPCLTVTSKGYFMS